MKKIILCSLLLLAVHLCVYSQWSVGARGGVLYSGIDFNNSTSRGGDYLPIWGGQAGLVTEYQINEHFSVLAEANYCQRGIVIDVNVNGNLFSTTSGYFNYIELPILFKAGLSLGKGFQGFAQIGPYGSYLVSGSSQSKIINTGQIFNFDNDVSKSDRFNLGALAGLGISLEALKGRFFFDIRYNRTLLNFEDVPCEYAYVYGFGAGIGYMYSISAKEAQ